MKNRQLVQPSNHSPHWKDAQAIGWLADICVVGVLRVEGAFRYISTYSLVLSLLDDDIDAHDRLLESFDAPGEELLDLGIP